MNISTGLRDQSAHQPEGAQTGARHQQKGAKPLVKPLALAQELMDLAEEYPEIGVTLKLAAEHIVGEEVRFGELALEMSELKLLLADIKSKTQAMLGVVSKEGKLSRDEKEIYDLMQGMMLDLLDALEDAPPLDTGAMMDMAPAAAPTVTAAPTVVVTGDGGAHDPEGASARCTERGSRG